MPPSDPALVHTPNITLSAAEAALAACKAQSRQIGVPMNIAIVDATLYLLAFSRMPGAKLTSIDIAINKAFTAAGHREGTHTYREKAAVSGAPMVGVHNSNGGRFTTIGGGLPIKVNGIVVGAIGCSTGTPAQDQQVAQAGVDAVLELLGDERKIKAKL